MSEKLDAFIEDSKKTIGKEATEVLPGIWRGYVNDFETITSFTNPIGDTNHLYNDPDYAGRKTRYAGMLAPPTYVMAIRLPISEGAYSLKDYSLANFETGAAFEWFDVIRSGDRAGNTELRLVDVSKRAGAGWLKGREVATLTSEAKYYNWDGRLICRGRGEATMVPIQRGKELLYDRYIYQYKDPEEVDPIIEGVENEVVRGSKPLYWEEVTLGSKLQPVVKGPAGIGDFTPWLMATRQFVTTNETMYLEALKKPGYRRTNPETGWPYFFGDAEPMDIQSSSLRGFRCAFSTGTQVVGLCGNVVTNWMSDEGFLRRLSVETDEPFLYGDTLFIKGIVTDKYKEKVGDAKYNAVDVKMEAINQIGKLAASGTATVYLPGRGLPVKLPIPQT